MNYTEFRKQFDEKNRLIKEHAKSFPDKLFFIFESDKKKDLKALLEAKVKFHYSEYDGYFLGVIENTEIQGFYTHDEINNIESILGKNTQYLIGLLEGAELNDSGNLFIKGDSSLLNDYFLSSLGVKSVNYEDMSFENETSLISERLVLEAKGYLRKYRKRSVIPVDIIFVFESFLNDDLIALKPFISFTISEMYKELGQQNKSAKYLEVFESSISGF